MNKPLDTSSIGIPELKRGGIIFGILIFPVGIFYFHILPNNISLIGFFLSLFGGCFITFYVTRNISDFTKEKIQEIELEKEMYIESNKKKKQRYYREYKALLDGIHSRGSQIHAAFSIIIASSILVVTPLLQAYTNNNFQKLEITSEAQIGFPLNILSLVALILISVTILLNSSSRELDTISWRRIYVIELRLGIEGHHWLRKRSGYDFVKYRSVLWPLLFATLLTLYTFLTYFVFIQYF